MGVFDDKKNGKEWKETIQEAKEWTGVSGKNSKKGNLRKIWPAKDKGYVCSKVAISDPQMSSTDFN